MTHKATSSEAELVADAHSADSNDGAARASSRPPRWLPPPLSASERWCVGVLSSLSAIVLLWAALSLPWQPYNVFTLLCVSTGVGHLVTTGFCLTSPHPRFPLLAWRTTSLAAAALLAWTTWIVARSGAYLSALYGGLGQGLTAAMVGVWALAVLITLPLLAWGLVRTRGSFPRLLPRRGSATAAVVVGAGLLIAALFIWSETAQARQASAVPAKRDEWNALLDHHVAPVLAGLPEPRSNAKREKKKSQPARLSSTAIAACSTAVATGHPDPPLLLVHYVTRSGRPKAACLSEPSLEQLAQSLAARLRADAARAAIAVDRVTHTRALNHGPTWLAALRVRPGLDGVCVEDKCLAPWQILAQGMFTNHSPLDFLADLKFGISVAELRDRLMADEATDPAQPLLAFATQSSTVLKDGTVHPLRRLRPEQAEVTRSAVMKAESELEQHILQSQQKNGQFRYTLDPFTGKKETRNFNIPRQAGTLLAICELGRETEGVRQAVHDGLKLLVRHHRRRDGRWALSLNRKARVVRLGDAALPLIAFIACRPRVGAEFDDAIAGLSKFVLDMQNDDGSFASTFDWKKRKKLLGPEALYAPGQSILGLVLLDLLLVETGDSAFSEEAPLSSPQLREAIQRAMNHVSAKHWDIPAHSFFFVEENWNCLTARAALARQRNDDYERFCLDYITFKMRLILGPESRVDPQYLGGFGFGNVIPPHNTGAAGVGEALAAAIIVKDSRGEDATEEREVMRSIMAFLLSQQWTSTNCFACVPEALGSISEHTHSPITRIDFAQHAWAALGHGQQALEP